MRKNYNLYIGERTAEKIKCQIGIAYPQEERLLAFCNGRDLISGLPKTVEISSEEILEALDEPLTVICDAVHGVLEKTPPELAADVGESGIVITGGGAYLKGLDKRIEKRTGIKTIVAADADYCVAKGTGESLKYIDVISRNSLNRRETYI